MGSTLLQTAATLAQALDDDDYDIVIGLLAENVEYVIGDRTLLGPAAVAQSYRDSSEMAHRLFDRVEYGHEIGGLIDPNTVRIRYSDVLTVGGETLTHQAEQHVTIDESAGVIRIIDQPVPGEREKVDAFMSRHGLSREG